MTMTMTTTTTIVGRVVMIPTATATAATTTIFHPGAKPSPEILACVARLCSAKNPSVVMKMLTARATTRMMTTTKVSVAVRQNGRNTCAAPSAKRRSWRSSTMTRRMTVWVTIATIQDPIQSPTICSKNKKNLTPRLMPSILSIVVSL